MIAKLIRFFANPHNLLSLRRFAKNRIGAASANLCPNGVLQFPLRNVRWCFSLVLSVSLHASPPESPSLIAEEVSLKKGINKWHILYLAQAGEWTQAMKQYRQYYAEIGRHDFEILQKMAESVILQGMRGSDPELQLVSIFGARIAGMSAPVECLALGITTPHPQTQIASIQSLGQLQDDQSETLLTKAMSSDYFLTRMEAAYQLSLRKSHSAVGQIESLMYRVPPQMRFFFPQFFALIGTPDAVNVLKHLMDEPFDITRIEAILSAAKSGRDDLLPQIRTRATHASVAEQEACAVAVGLLKDAKSLPLLNKMAKSPTPNVKLAALLSLYALNGKTEELFAMAKTGDLYAISCLGQVSGAENLLEELTRDPNLQVRFNATIALLTRRDPRAVKPLKEFLLRDAKDLGFQPHPSVGHALLSWKVTPSALQHQEKDSYDLIALSVSIREHMLHLCVELPEADFLFIARQVFNSGQTELIPFLVHLLENVRTEGALALLKQNASKAGAPLIRTYCSLSLLRMQQPGDYESSITAWIRSKRDLEMIRFRPMLPREVRQHTQKSPFELTPEENAQLLISCYQTLAERHDPQGIDLLLDGLENGHPHNRAVLAGLLMYALQ